MAFGSINVPGGWYCTLLARLASLERLLEGLEKLTGGSDPTSATKAQVGQIYINIATGQEWICTAVSDSGTTWELSMDSASSKVLDELLARLASLERLLEGLEKLTGGSDPTSATKAQVGQIYINIATGQEWICTAVSDSGTTWKEYTAEQMKLFAVGASMPERTDVLWIDTTAVTGGLKYHNGSAWVSVPTSTV